MNAQQQESGFACTDFTNLDRVLPTTVYVNFHYILDGNGEGNFRVNDDGNGNNSVTGRTTAENLISQMNYTLGHLQQNISKKCDGTPNGLVSDAKIRFEIYYDASDPDMGIHYIQSQSLYDAVRFSSQTSPGTLKQNYSIYGDNVLDIFMFAHAPGQACNVWGEAALGSFNTWCLWHYYTNNEWYKDLYPGLSIHEALHYIGLISEANSSECETYDIEKIEESQIGNNIMRNNGGDKTALTPKQFILIQNSLGSLDYTNADINCNTNNPPIIIPSGQTIVWNSPSRINSEVIVEPLATLIINCDVFTNSRILVQSAGKLIVEGAMISSLCPKESFWPGIEVEGSTKDHALVNIFGTLQPDDPGVVLLNNAVIDNAVVGVGTLSQENPWFGGGIIRAQVSTFSNNRKAIAFYPYRNENVSFFKECNFSSSKGYAGISMWDVHGVEVEDCDFDNMGPGITLYNPNGQSNPNTITGDLGIITIDASPIIFNNCTFQNLTHAIDAKSSIDLSFGRGGFNIGLAGSASQPNIFDNNKTHVFCLGILGMKIHNNTFKNSTESIYFSGKSNYEIINNEISSFKNGLISRHVSDLSNTIRNNKWVSSIPVSRGIFAFGQNQNMGIDLNCFTVKENDVLVFTNNKFKEQGTNDDPSMNLFSHNLIGSRDLICQVATPAFNYWHPDPGLFPNLDPRLIPLCARNNRAGSCTANSIHLNQKSDNNPNITIANCNIGESGFPNDDIDQEVYDLDDYNYWKTRTINLNAIIDGGDQANLINLLVNQPNSIATANALNAASPYLSSVILSELINSAMLSVTKFNILSANAPIPFTFEEQLLEIYTAPEVANLVGEYYHPLPALRDTMQAAYDHANFNRLEIGFQLCQNYTFNGQYSNALNLINDIDNPDITKLKLGIYVLNEDYSTGESFLDNFPIQDASDQAWVDVSRIALRLYSDPSSFVLSPDEDARLEELSLSFLPEAAQASALLYLFKEKLFDISEDIYDEPQGIQVSNKDLPNLINQKNILIYPNPATSEIIIDLLSDNYISLNIRINNLQGINLYKDEIKNPAKRNTINISDLPTGIYIIQVNNDKEVCENKWIFKQ